MTGDHLLGPCGPLYCPADGLQHPRIRQSATASPLLLACTRCPTQVGAMLKLCLELQSHGCLGALPACSEQAFWCHLFLGGERHCMTGMRQGDAFPCSRQTKLSMPYKLVPNVWERKWHKSMAHSAKASACRFTVHWQTPKM